MSDDQNRPKDVQLTPAQIELAKAAHASGKASQAVLRELSLPQPGLDSNTVVTLLSVDLGCAPVRGASPMPDTPSLDEEEHKILLLLLKNHPVRVRQEEIEAIVGTDRKTVRSRLQRLRTLGYTFCPGRGEGLMPEGERLARSLPPLSE